MRKFILASMVCAALLTVGVIVLAQAPAGGTAGGMADHIAGTTVSLDTARIEQLTGLKGSFDAKEGVFKVSYPRSDIQTTAAGVKLTPPMGLTCWVAFKDVGDHVDVHGRHGADRGSGQSRDDRRPRQRPGSHRAAQPLLLGQPQGHVHAHRRHGRPGKARRGRRQGLRETQRDQLGRG